MAEINNEHEITGTLYGKKTRTAEGKKATNLGKVYEFYYFIVEVPTRKTWTSDGKEKSVEKKELIKFKLSMGMNPDDFEVGDHIFVRFTITGREFEKKDGSGKDVINENEIKLIKITDTQIDKDKTAQTSQTPKRDTTFMPAQQSNDNEDENLPFILTIPITIGILSQLIPVFHFNLFV